jgi:hypothetical protein
MIYALLAAFAFGALVGSFVSWGFDRAELAAYRRLARGTGLDQR